MNSRIEKQKHKLKEIKKEKKTERKEKDRSVLKRKLRTFLAFILLLIILIIIYARYIEPNFLEVNEYKITTSKISNNFHGTKIVQFSDLHYGSTIDKKNIDKIIDKINILKPDIVIFSGDLIDNDYNITNTEINSLISKLKEINSNLGKYAVIGNHDVYNKNYERILSSSNFTLLKNSYDLVYNEGNNPILIYGLDDILYGDPNMDLYNDETLNNIDYKIIIMHEPDYIDSIIYDYDVDLILAGHSHNGQVRIPFIGPVILPPGANNYYKPYYKLNNTKVFISNGLGTSTLKLRFNDFPSINLFRLTNK